jgi:hypothetical protein
MPTDSTPPETRRIADRLRERLAHRSAFGGPWVAAALAALLTLPSLRAGWYLDDHYHRYVLLDLRLDPAERSTPLDMFRFMDGDAARTHKMMNIGVVPWWTDPEIKGRFWRPVTVLTHWFDTRLWPESARLQHLHNVAWYALLAASAAVLYRRLNGPTWIAGLAAVMYAVDDGRGMAVGWIANRNEMITTTFGVLALIAHDRWRRDRSLSAAVVAPLMLAAALLAKESAAAVAAYVAAYALFLDRGSRRDRVMTLLPAAVVIVAWRVAWTSMNYGVQHMGLYVDPLAEPMAFAEAVASRLPMLLLGLWLFPPADLQLLFHATGRWILLLAATAVIVVLLWAMIPTLRRSPTARFYATGMLLAAVPFCSTFPSDRLMFFSAIGAFGLLAEFLADALGRLAEPGTAPARAPIRRAIAYVLVGVHLMLAPLALPLRAAYPVGPYNYMDRFHVRTPLDPSVTEKTLVIINAPSAIHAGYIGPLNKLEGRPVPKFARVLASGESAVTVSRVDAHTLDVRPHEGYLVWIFDRLFREPHRALRLGERVELTGMTAEVTALTDDGRPAEVAFRFDVPLEDESLVWLCWDRERSEYDVCRPPGTGETTAFDAP